MKSFLKIATLVLFLNTGPGFLYAQQAVSPVAEKMRAFKITAYTVEDNKQVIRVLTQAGYQITYSCIPAGIIVVESKQAITEAGQTNIVNGLKSAKADIQYQILEGFTLEQAEQKCSSIRNSPGQYK
ncbi:MAG: hypothetical protein ACHQRM_01165 [Bacteroidia bacterium]